MDGYFLPTRTCSSIIVWRSAFGSMYLAELDLRARLALGGQPPPGAVELVEGEAHDLPALGGLLAHACSDFPSRFGAARSSHHMPRMASTPIVPNMRSGVSASSTAAQK